MRSEQKTQSKWFRHGAGFLLCAVAAVFALSLSGCDLFPSSASSFSGTKYAVVVGINDYENSDGYYLRDLNYCVNDANSVYTELNDAGWNVTLLTAPSGSWSNTTKAKIKLAIENISGADTFLFYYSGHGYSDSSDNAYIIPSDVDNTTESTLTSTSISTTEFSEWLADVDATNKLVVLDSCYSGGFVDSGDSVDGITDVQQGWTTSIQTASAIDMAFRFGELLAKNIAAASSDLSSSPLVISAASSEEESIEDSRYGDGHGIFTYYFLQAADTNSSGTMYGDSDGDDVLSCIEAYNYTKNKLASDSNISSDEEFLPHI